MSQQRSKPDGRRLRTARTRAAIAKALVELAENGVRAPTKEQIAERAGVSARAVFIHFPNVFDLARAELDGILEEFAPRKAEPAQGGAEAIESRLQRYVDLAMHVRMRFAPIQAIAGTMERLQDVLRRAEREIGDRLRHEAESTFAAELAHLPPLARLDCAVAITALVAPASWNELSRLAAAVRRPPIESQKSAIRRLLGC